MNMEQVASYLEIGMWVVVAVLTLIGVLKGRKRGLFRQLIRTASLVASIFISFAITKMAYNTITEKISDSIIEEIQEGVRCIAMIKYDRLWETMKKRNITQYALYTHYNVNRSQINRLRQNKNVEVNTIDKLCNILNCRVEDIMEHFPDDNHF